jgi:hypothetical protein
MSYFDLLDEYLIIKIFRYVWKDNIKKINGEFNRRIYIKNPQNIENDYRHYKMFINTGNNNLTYDDIMFLHKWRFKAYDVNDGYFVDGVLRKDIKELLDKDDLIDTAQWDAERKVINRYYKNMNWDRNQRNVKLQRFWTGLPWRNNKKYNRIIHFKASCPKKDTYESFTRYMKEKEKVNKELSKMAIAQEGTDEV